MPRVKGKNVRECQSEIVDKKRVLISQPSVDRQVEGRIFAPEGDLLTRMGGRRPNPGVHAQALNRMTNGEPSRARQSILQLQRAYGNRYVQRVVDVARQGEGEGEVTPDVEVAIERSRGGGQPLDTGVRRQMEGVFGADFSAVRIHTGPESHSLNRAVNAIAFTTGRDIFFRDGTYNPESSGGRELLAHELTHVVQHGGASPIPAVAQRFQVQRMCPDCEDEKKTASIQGKLTVGQPDDQYEQEADRLARAVTRELDAVDVGAKAQTNSFTAGLQSYSCKWDHSLQRTIGDGHDLKAPRFAGDPVLEACFDNEQLLRFGSRGPAVQKIQQALIDAGFPLPQFGVDGNFGAETQAAVRSYQTAHGLAPDGIVGPLTMGNMDALFAAPAPPGPAPVPPGPVPPAPVPPGPVPPGPVPPGPVRRARATGSVPPAPPAHTLTTDLRALITAGNTTYADYKAKIVAAPVAERTAVLGDTALLRSIQGQLAFNDFAKVVELLGRSAPSAATMLANATVTAAMTAAFNASNPAVTLPPHDPAQPVGPCNPPAGTPPPAGVHEEAGWIYQNLITGALDTRRAAAGGQANGSVANPPDVADSVVVGTFHTHPNIGPCWGALFPSGTDTNSANGAGVPFLIMGAFPDVAHTQTTSTGPGQRLHLAGGRGFPGATGGDAPQATIDGSFDEL